jgi:heme-degrading monooxygenase HmoA
MKLKPSQYNVTDLTKTVDEKILPLLRKQEGFKDAVFFASPGSAEAISVSVWDRKESADAYNEKAYPEVLKSLTNLLDGNPQIKTFDVISSTLHKAATTTV